MIKALARSCPDRVLAGWSRRFRIAISGTNPRNKRPFIWHLFHARGGGGASSAGDGWETAGEGQAAGGIKFGSVEVAETRFPLFFKRHEFRPGLRRATAASAAAWARCSSCAWRPTEPALGNTAGDGVRHPAYGVLGGKDGLPHRYRMLVARQDARAQDQGGRRARSRPAPSSSSSPWAAAATARPRARPAEARAADRDNGFVSAQARARGKA